MKSQKTNKKTRLSAAIGFAFLILFAQPQRAGAQQWATNGNHITNTNSGNVGIGTMSPAAKLDILSSGSARVIAGDGCFDLGAYGGVGLGISSFSGCTNYTILGNGTHSYFNAPSGDLYFRVGNQDKMVIRSNGNVGIGTSSFTKPLTIKKDVMGDVQLHLTSNGVSLYLGAQWINGLPAIGTADLNPIDFVTNNTFRARIDSSGNFGIGTTAPTTRLHVVGDGRVTGNLTVDGNIAAKYQDLAEWVPAAAQIPAATVVVLDHTISNRVIASTQAYDTRVAGVISAKPGIALGESGDNKVLVATTGRVRIKVDATRGAIHIGDLLVTSDISGMAMKSEPINIGGVQIHRPGTLIGKALEPLEKGKGEILALLSLQ